MATVERVFQRPSGAEVKVTAQAMYGAGLALSIDVCVYSRENGAEPWRLMNDRPAIGWKAMGRAEYLEHGRSEALKCATHAEILSVSDLLFKQVTA